MKICTVDVDAFKKSLNMGSIKATQVIAIIEAVGLEKSDLISPESVECPPGSSQSTPPNPLQDSKALSLAAPVASR